MRALLGSLTLSTCEAIDGGGNGCEYRRSFRGSHCKDGEANHSRGVARRHVGPSKQIKFLGCARLHADGGSGNVALWRKHAVPRTGGAGRNAIYSGLRNGTAIARVAMERTGRGPKSRDAHSGDALSLGSHSRDSVFYAAVRGKQCVSFLQFSVEISGARQLEAGI